jgi:hypothetical protein
MSFCKYSTLFGKPEEGVHKWRIFGLAGADLLLTAGLAALVTRLTKWKPQLATFIITFLLLIVASVFIHHAFCVKTALVKMLEKR